MRRRQIGDRFYKWNTDVRDKSEKQIVWEVIDQLPSDFMLGSFKEIFSKYKQLYRESQQVSQKYLSVEIDSETNYDNILEYFLIGKREETESEFLLRQQKLKKIQDDNDKNEADKVAKEKYLLQKLKDKYEK